MDGPPVVGRRQRAGPRDCARWRAQHPDHERPGRPCWRSRTSWRACSRRRAAMPCAAPYPARDGAAPCACWAGRAAGGLRPRPAWHRRLAWRHRRLPQRHREIRALTLPDGTRLTLSTGTAIDLRFDANARLVVLLAGEILVATAPDPAATPRPFRVRGRHGTVQAWARASRSAKTTRMRAWRCSRARLKSARRRARRRHPPGCGPGLAFSRYRADPPIPVSEDAASWSRGVLVADARRLDDFLAELGRYRPGSLRCDPPSRTCA